MKNGWSFWIFMAILVVLHFVLHLSLGLGRSAPDLLTLAVLLGARQFHGPGAAALGFGLGLLEDAVSVGAFGAAAMTQTVVGYLGARSRDLFVGESLLFLVLYLFLGKWLHDALYYLIAPAVRRGEPVLALLVDAPLAALYVAAVGFVAILAYRSLARVL
ncbi:MAG TPA: rod shape-determining protein MreD [Longimicrobiales bacterium]|nr:rod shape-determining protein MreD [Longimicrobiales bacterium]